MACDSGYSILPPQANFAISGGKVTSMTFPSGLLLPGSFERHGVFQADRGVVVRDYSVRESELSLRSTVTKDVGVIIGEFASGSVLLTIDGKNHGRIGVQGGKATFRGSVGEHRVELRN